MATAYILMVIYNTRLHSFEHRNLGVVLHPLYARAKTPVNPKLLHPEIQGRAVQSQTGCCAAWSGKNPSGFLQGPEDMVALDLFQSLMTVCALIWRDPRIQVPGRKPQDRAG